MRALLSNPNEQCITFLLENVAYYFGYRFLEGKAMILNNCLNHPAYSSPNWGNIPSGKGNLPTLPLSFGWKVNWLAVYDTPEPDPAMNLSFRSIADGSAWCKVTEKDQEQEFYFKPVEDGVQIWLRFTALQTITTSYCIQQCLRFTGRMNAEWRQAVAYMPFLSELDMQAMGNPNETLTYVRRNHEWLNLGVPHTMYPIQAVSLEIPALSPDCVDNGLIVRQTPDRKQAPAGYFQQVTPGAKWDQVTAGMYWERTAFISNRHPADCVHTWIDVGPLEAGQSRILHGKVYYIEDDKEILLQHMQKDFGNIG